MKINVHSGHCPSGSGGATGAVGYLDESKEDRYVKNELIKNLRDLGHVVYDCTDDTCCDERTNLRRIVAKCNAHNVDLDVSIHLNAGGGTGVEVWTRNSNLEKTCGRICQKVSQRLGIPNRGVKHTNSLYVLNHTNAPALLVECCFVDSRSDKYHWNPIACANAIAEGITGSSLAPEKPKPAKPKTVACTGTLAVVRKTKTDNGKVMNVGDAITVTERTVGGNYSFKCSAGWVSGRELKGWLVDGRKWWYIDKGYVPKKEWKWIDGVSYYFKADGYMAKNTYIRWSDTYCRVNGSGAWLKAWDIPADQWDGKIL